MSTAVSSLLSIFIWIRGYQGLFLERRNFLARVKETKRDSIAGSETLKQATSSELQNISAPANSNATG